MAAAKIDPEGWPCCPVCLKQFNKPRQLPCAHSFCEKCLQSHITTQAEKHGTFRYDNYPASTQMQGTVYKRGMQPRRGKKLLVQRLQSVECPVCGDSSCPSVKDIPTSKWASLFPANTVLQSVLPEKSKVDRFCDACRNDGAAVAAEGLCVVCKEAMCGDCLKSHRKQTVSKDHPIIFVEGLAFNPENVTKLAEGFTCWEHKGEDIIYYCKDHKVPCCGTCFFEGHRICSSVIDLKRKLPVMLHDSMTDEIIAKMKEIELHLKKFMEMKEANVNNLKSQVNKMTDQIREIRKKINSVLDELEKQVKIKGSRIYKEEVIRKQEENHQCLSLMHAVRNSHYHLEIVHKYGSNLQKYLVVKR